MIPRIWKKLSMAERPVYFSEDLYESVKTRESTYNYKPSKVTHSDKKNGELFPSFTGIIKPLFYSICFYKIYRNVRGLATVFARCPIYILLYFFIYYISFVLFLVFTVHSKYVWLLLTHVINVLYNDRVLIETLCLISCSTYPNNWFVSYFYLFIFTYETSPGQEFWRN